MSVNRTVAVTMRISAVNSAGDDGLERIRVVQYAGDLNLLLEIFAGQDAVLVHQDVVLAYRGLPEDLLDHLVARDRGVVGELYVLDLGGGLRAALADLALEHLDLDGFGQLLEELAAERLGHVESGHAVFGEDLHDLVAYRFLLVVVGEADDGAGRLLLRSAEFQVGGVEQGFVLQHQADHVVRRAELGGVQEVRVGAVGVVQHRSRAGHLEWRFRGMV